MEKNLLNHEQAYHLYRWWDAHADKLTHLTQPVITECANTDLPFTVSVSNIQAAMKVTGKRNRPLVHRSNGASKSTYKVRVVAKELNRLFRQLGIEPSPDLKAIVGGRSVNGEGTSP